MNARTPKSETVVIPIVAEDDIVRARSRGREVCRALGFTEINQVKVATAISELARNIFQYAGKGSLTLTTVESPRKGIEVIARDEGKGIPDLKLVLSGSYRSKSGMGMGLLGTKRLMDFFEVETAPEKGTVVTVRKFLR
jgi:serine/threonine-protein kinase RsbT